MTSYAHLQQACYADCNDYWLCSCLWFVCWGRGEPQECPQYWKFYILPARDLGSRVIYFWYRIPQCDINNCFGIDDTWRHKAIQAFSGFVLCNTQHSTFCWGKARYDMNAIEYTNANTVPWNDTHPSTSFQVEFNSLPLALSSFRNLTNCSHRAHAWPQPKWQMCIGSGGAQFVHAVWQKTLRQKLSWSRPILNIFVNWLRGKDQRGTSVYVNKTVRNRLYRCYRIKSEYNPNSLKAAVRFIRRHHVLESVRWRRGREAATFSTVHQCMWHDALQRWMSYTDHGGVGFGTEPARPVTIIASKILLNKATSKRIPSTSGSKLLSLITECTARKSSVYTSTGG